MFDQIIEQKIQEAIRNGEFDDLEGAGQPLHLVDESDIPPESRLAYRILKNSGYLPEEMQIRKDIKSLEQMLLDLPDDQNERRLELLASINENWARYHAVIARRRKL